MKRTILIAVIAAAIGAATSAAVIATNADALYAWHWRTFVYKGAP